jgi:tetratricopeptide (TPR) repeat protein
VQNTAPVDPLIGRTVSQYEIVAKLGGGGMGVVYKARDIRLGRTVALKFLPPEWSHDEGAKQRFVREAQAASATNHRNICVIHNIDETSDGRLFIVMAHYEGETLKQKLERGPLPIAETLEIACGIAEGLAKAHAQGVIHRDVKPGNLIVTDDGVKILDFGLAKFADALQLTVPGTTIGTVAYMSPEQARGEEADARSDVWALGIVMYEMLTGAAPFRGGYPEATLHAIKHEPLPALRAARPDVPESLERIVLRALEKDPALRYQSGREPARELRLLQGRTVPLDLQTEEVPTIAAFRRESPVRRSRLRSALTPVRVGLALMLLAMTAAGVTYWYRRPVERIPVVVVPVANQTGIADLDRYRLALTQTLIDEVSESPNIRVVPYLRLLEMIRPFLGGERDMSGNEAMRAIATASGAPFLVVPALVYRDRDATWVVHVQIRDAVTGTTAATYQTAPVTSSLSQQTAFRLIASAADSLQQHFRTHGPGLAFQPRAPGSRFRDPEASRAFEEGLSAYDQLEHAAALEALTRSTGLEDQHALTHAWLSRVLLILARRNEAVGAARTARSLAAGNLSASESAFVGAVLAESQGDFDGADVAYRQMVALEPDDPWALVELADFLKRRPDRNQPAIAAYHDVMRVDPGYIRPHVELCQLYTRIDDHPLAEKEGQLALERYRALGIRGGEGQALLCLGDTKREQGGAHLVDARTLVGAARAVFESLAYPYNLSRAVLYQGNVELSGRRLRDANRFFEEAAERTNAVGNRMTEAVVLMNLGGLNVSLGQPSRSLDFLRRGRRVFVDLGDERRAAEIDVNAAALEIEYGGDRTGALRTLGNARANLERLGHADFQVLAMVGEAQSQQHAGHLERARTLLASALEKARSLDLRYETRLLRVRLGEADVLANKYSTARSLLQEVVDSSSGAGRLEARSALGQVLVRMGETEEARRVLESALADLEPEQRFDLAPQVHGALGELAYQTGDLAAARAHFDSAVRLWTDPLPNASSVEALCYRGLVDAVSGRRRSGRADLEKGVARAASTGRIALEARCRIQLARVHVADGRFGEATKVLRGIPDEAADRSIGPELRAEADYWEGAARESQRDPDARDRYDRARAAIVALQSSLDAAVRDKFAARPDIRAILEKTIRREP